MGIKVGICGAGHFAANFIGLYKAHPQVEEVVLADLAVDRARAAADQHGIRRVMGSLDELCRSDVDAIAIFTQRHLHAPQAIQALNAGKHVLCAVPPALSMDDLATLVQTVERTGLVYMLNETSYYYPAACYARERFQKGDMGRFVYAEAQYLHDMSQMYGSFQHSGGANWKRVAGFPPMFYCTHSVSLVLSVTGARATHVSCLGYVDNHEDHIFRVGANEWDNVFSNESALMRTSDGGSLRINEFRRVGWDAHNMTTMSLYGTGGTLEENPLSVCWTRLAPPEQVDVLPHLRVHAGGTGSGFLGVSAAHPVHRLPESFKGLKNGHQGSHFFLVDDFVRAASSGRQPPCNVWNAARWTLPGLVAHESARREGEMLRIPDLGAGPAGGAF
ncbi:MAG: Gfo/Idh/MocA family oxidoreductase [Lentisphaerae bacterium]|nr:Gfo/Idh/MocA family oxidoreductase [Lentisphaerota bacterium]